jgi:hypothetical protein
MGVTMRLFIYILVVWSAVFASVFALLLYDGGDDNGKEGVGSSEYSHQAIQTPTPTPRSTSTTIVPKQQQQVTDQNDIVQKEISNIKNANQGDSEIPEDEDEINGEIENKLVDVVTKIDASDCKKCGKKEKKTILQIKMMKAIVDNKPKTVQKISKELDTYLLRKKTLKELKKQEMPEQKIKRYIQTKATKPADDGSFLYETQGIDRY